MNKFFHIILIFIALANICQAQNKDIDPNGYNKFYYGNGQVSSEGYMKNGKPDGYWKTYYVNGTIKSEGKRNNFELDSIWVFYDEDGDTLKKINYRDGKKNGYYITFNYSLTEDSIKKGSIVSKELYLNDVMQGRSFYYDAAGYLSKEIPFTDNKKNGIAREYAKDGRITAIIEYINDVLVNREYINRYVNDTLKNGVWKEFYSNNQVKKEMNYVSGKLHGLYKEYEINGNLLKVLKYTYGELAVEDTASTDSLRIDKDLFKKLVEEYYENGKLKYMGAFNDSIPVGLHKEYSMDGKTIQAKQYDDFGNLTAEGQYNENGKKTGEWKYYYESGTVKTKGTYTGGKRTGTWYFYFEDGRIEQQGNYKSGKYDGEWKWYYYSGKIEREEMFEGGKANGPFVEYTEEGQVIEKGNFIDGEKDGPWFYNSGDEIEEGNYQTGLRNGYWRHYFLDRKLSYEGNFIQGSPDGKHKIYYETGRIKTEARYILGSREGNWYYYNQEGDCFLIVRFRDDVEYKINGEKINIPKE